MSIIDKLRNLVKFGVVTKASTDTEDMQRAQLSQFGILSTVTLITPYGLYSNLTAGTKVITFDLLAQAENKIGIGFSQDDRFKNLAVGEVVVGNPKTQSFIKFDEEGNIQIESDAKVTITAANEIEIKTSDNVDIDADNVNIDAAQTNLGFGGAEIARKGDIIKVTVGGTDYFGTIETGGVNTSI